jgi:hypothetical protein
MINNDEKPKHGGIQNYFYGPIGQYIEHVEHNHFGMGKEYDEQQKEIFPELPSVEVMTEAVKATIRNGHWWSNRSWAVVYRVYQLKGYMKSIMDFVRDVEQWGVTTSYVCNYDAVQKPVLEGTMIGAPETWEANGASKQCVRLAEALLAEIKARMKKTP